MSRSKYSIGVPERIGIDWDGDSLKFKTENEKLSIDSLDIWPLVEMLKEVMKDMERAGHLPYAIDTTEAL